MSPASAEGRGRLLAVVFLDGDYGDPSWYRALAARADILLAADGGAAFLAAQGLVPQAIVGDFDSLAEGVAEALEERGAELVRHPVRKDVTDGELAVEEALRRGAGEVMLAGATGALDHTLGHLAILRRLAARGVAARLVGPDLAVTVLVAPAEVVLVAPTGVRVSLAPFGAGATVTLKGFEYPLRHGMLPADACLGLGNHVAVADPRVVVHEGTVVVIVEWGEESFAPAGRRPGEV
jgi:thiamine pyrophosphokinase